MAKVVQITAENFEAEVMPASEERAVAILFSSAEYPDCAPYSQLLGTLSTSMDFTLGVVSCDERENMRLIQMFPKSTWSIKVKSQTLFRAFFPKQTSRSVLKSSMSRTKLA